MSPRQQSAGRADTGEPPNHVRDVRGTSRITGRGRGRLRAPRSVAAGVLAATAILSTYAPAAGASAADAGVERGTTSTSTAEPAPEPAPVPDPAPVPEPQPTSPPTEPAPEPVTSPPPVTGPGTVTPQPANAPASADGVPFTIAVIPDTQGSTAGTGATFRAQTAWLAENAERLRLAFVLHEGDVVDDLCQAKQWQRGSDAMRTLEAARIPYAIAPGNHDTIRYGTCGPRAYTTASYDTTFPLTRAAAVPGFGGSFDGTAVNTWYTFTAGGDDYLVVALQFGPTRKQLTWARDVALAHPEHRAILVTHDLIGNDGLLRGSESETTYALPSLPGQLDGTDIWDSVVAPAGTFVMTVNGHISTCQGAPVDCAVTGIVARSSADGVHRMLANYQSFTTKGAAPGDSGFLRLLTVHPDHDVVQVATYSPTLDRYLTDSANRFLLTDGYLSPFPDPGAFPLETGDAQRRGLVTGYTDATFRPTASVTRQAAAAMVYRASPGAMAGPLTCTAHRVRSLFTDVADDHPFCFAIRELAATGQIRGYPDGTFGPDRSVTREAFTAFMFSRAGDRSAAAELFGDVSTDAQLGASISSASRAGVITGYTDGSFRPTATITRQAGAAMIVRYFYHLRAPA